MLLKTFKPFTGPVKYVFKDPDTSFIYQAADKKELLNRIVSYRKQNELEPIEALDIVVDNYLCGLPENRANCKHLPLERNWMGYVRGGLALLKNMLYKSYVSQAVADERASICIQCPHNVFPDKGNFLIWSDTQAEAAVGDRKSIHHDRLGNCEICTCTLKAKVWFGDEIVLPQEEYVQLPDFCWQKKEGRPNIKKTYGR